MNLIRFAPMLVVLGISFSIYYFATREEKPKKIKK
jgi:hypothetical protein